MVKFELCVGSYIIMDSKVLHGSKQSLKFRRWHDKKVVIFQNSDFCSSIFEIFQQDLNFLFFLPSYGLNSRGGFHMYHNVPIFLGSCWVDSQKTRFLY